MVLGTWPVLFQSVTCIVLYLLWLEALRQSCRRQFKDGKDDDMEGRCNNEDIFTQRHTTWRNIYCQMSYTWKSAKTYDLKKRLLSDVLYVKNLTIAVRKAYETSFTVRGATGVTIQPHQILRLSRRKTHMLSPHHIWNVIYSARNNRCHDPTSPNTAPVTQKDSHT